MQDLAEYTDWEQDLAVLCPYVFQFNKEKQILLSYLVSTWPQVVEGQRRGSPLLIALVEYTDWGQDLTVLSLPVFQAKYSSEVKDTEGNYRNESC